MSFEVLLLNQPCFQPAANGRFAHRIVQSAEISGAVEEVFPPSSQARIAITIGNKILKLDFISFGEILDEWLCFCVWILNNETPISHFDPWCNDVRLSFDARRTDDNTVILESTSGDIFEDPKVSNIMSASSEVFLTELNKSFALVRMALENHGKMYPLLNVVSKRIKMKS